MAFPHGRNQAPETRLSVDPTAQYFDFEFYEQSATTIQDDNSNHGFSATLDSRNPAQYSYPNTNVQHEQTKPCCVPERQRLFLNGPTFSGAYSEPGQRSSMNVAVPGYHTSAFPESVFRFESLILSSSNHQPYVQTNASRPNICESGFMPHTVVEPSTNAPHFPHASSSSTDSTFSSVGNSSSASLSHSKSTTSSFGSRSAIPSLAVPSQDSICSPGNLTSNKRRRCEMVQDELITTFSEGAQQDARVMFTNGQRLDQAAISVFEVWLQTFPSAFPGDVEFANLALLTKMDVDGVRSWFVNRLHASGSSGVPLFDSWLSNYPSAYPGDDEFASLAALSSLSVETVKMWFVRRLRKNEADIEPTPPITQSQASVTNTAGAFMDSTTGSESPLLKPLLDRAALWVHREKGTKCTPCSDLTLLLRDDNRPFQCTHKCGKKFKDKDDWRKHEEVNYPQEGWLCDMSTSIVVAGVLICTCCGKPDPEPDHYAMHKKPVCHDKEFHTRGRLHYRKQHFIQHFTNVHLHVPCTTFIVDNHFVVEGHFPKRCGFCVYRFESWRDRIDHISVHFHDDNKDMTQWDDQLRRGRRSRGHDNNRLDEDDDDSADDSDDSPPPRAPKPSVFLGSSTTWKQSGSIGASSRYLRRNLDAEYLVGSDTLQSFQSVSFDEFVTPLSTGHNSFNRGPNDESPGSSLKLASNILSHGLRLVRRRRSLKIPPFTRTRVLGCGPYSVVDEVQSWATGDVFARKTINYPSSGSTRLSAMDEVEIMKRLNHPHIVHFVGTYILDHSFSILMSPVADFDLDQLMSGVNSMAITANAIAQWFTCLVSSVDYLHGKAIKHQDIKPSNILIKGQKIFLADFGIAKAFTYSEPTTPTTGIMTRKYCSPETARDGLRGRKADIFSLGCVFLEMFSFLILQDRQPNFVDFQKAHFVGGKAYHENLPTVRRWIQTLRDYRLVVREDYLERLLDACALMLSEVSQERPSAAELSEAFPPAKCCLSTRSTFSLRMGVRKLPDTQRNLESHGIGHPETSTLWKLGKPMLDMFSSPPPTWIAIIAPCPSPGGGGNIERHPKTSSGTRTATYPVLACQVVFSSVNECLSHVYDARARKDEFVKLVTFRKLQREALASALQKKFDIKHDPILATRDHRGVTSTVIYHREVNIPPNFVKLSATTERTRSAVEVRWETPQSNATFESRKAWKSQTRVALNLPILHLLGMLVLALTCLFSRLRMPAWRTSYMHLQSPSPIMETYSWESYVWTIDYPRSMMEGSPDDLVVQSISLASLEDDHGISQDSNNLLRDFGKCPVHDFCLNSYTARAGFAMVGEQSRVEVHDSAQESSYELENASQLPQPTILDSPTLTSANCDNGRGPGTKDEALQSAEAMEGAANVRSFARATLFIVWVFDFSLPILFSLLRPQWKKLRTDMASHISIRWKKILGFGPASWAGTFILLTVCVLHRNFLRLTSCRVSTAKDSGVPHRLSMLSATHIYAIALNGTVGIGILINLGCYYVSIQHLHTHWMLLLAHSAALMSPLLFVRLALPDPRPAMLRPRLIQLPRWSSPEPESFPHFEPWPQFMSYREPLSTSEFEGCLERYHSELEETPVVSHGSPRMRRNTHKDGRQLLDAQYAESDSLMGKYFHLESLYCVTWYRCTARQMQTILYLTADPVCYAYNILQKLFYQLPFRKFVILLGILSSGLLTSVKPSYLVTYSATVPHGLSSGISLCKTSFEYGQGWSSRIDDIDHFMAPLLGFCVPVLCFWLSIPRRRTLASTCSKFLSRLKASVSIILSAGLPVIYLVIWAFVCLALAGPKLLSGLQEASLDQRLLSLLRQQFTLAQEHTDCQAAWVYCDNGPNLLSENNIKVLAMLHFPVWTTISLYGFSLASLRWLSSPRRVKITPALLVMSHCLPYLIWTSSSAAVYMILPKIGCTVLLASCQLVIVSLIAHKIQRRSRENTQLTWRFSSDQKNTTCQTACLSGSDNVI